MSVFFSLETTFETFWREGHRHENSWYSPADCATPIQSVTSNYPSSNNLKLQWDKDLEMYATLPSKLNQFICERDLPNEVPDCPEKCEYCVVNTDLKVSCICPNGRFGSNCQWR